MIASLLHFFMEPDDVLVYLSLHLFLERRETVKMAPTSFIWRIRFFCFWWKS